MKVLVINGSPKGKNSNSLKLTNAFVEGLGEIDLKQVDVASKNIGSCKGCFSCWNKTPGICIMQDDMSEIIEDELWADVIIWSFPLYYFNVPGMLKNLIDRQLPMSMPFMEERSDGYGSGSHPARYDMSGKRYVVISTCGFYSAKNNYDSIRSMFNHVCGNENYETIFCGQGELFRVKELKERTDEYLEIVKKAGREFVHGSITEETKSELSQLLFDKETFEEMADASWGVSKDGKEKLDETYTFTKQMAALYNKASHQGKDKVLEIRYTDKGKAYQIKLTASGSEVFDVCALEPTTIIETPYDVWTTIARGEIRGDEALMKGMYRVTGDFELMIHWKTYFGGASSAERSDTLPEGESLCQSEKKKPSMTTMLLPWMAFWIATSISHDIGPVIVMIICASIPLIYYKNKTTVYDVISIMAGAVFAGLCALTEKYDLIYIVSYLCFGLMWLLSCFTKEPVCAAYVKYNYNGDDALNNPIFMKTNYILAAGWGLLYICNCVVTFFLYKYGFRTVSLIVNNVAPAVMGMFTVWFEKWYPEYVAKRGGK